MNKFKQNISWKPEKKKNSCWNKKGIKAKIPTNQMEKKMIWVNQMGMLNMHVT